MTLPLTTPVSLGDRYTVERVIGSGGMATVHLAEEHKHQRKVAIKVKTTTEYVSPVELATVYIALGDKQRALDWIEAAVDDRRGWVAYLRVHPIMDSLRGEPRFAALIKRMKFEAVGS